jgi:hypothetical protein
VSVAEEAKLIETDGGLEPEGEGWFVVNVRDTTWWKSEVFGASCPFEGNEDEKRSVEAETAEPREAYARFPSWERAPLEDAGPPWQ